MQNTNPAPDRDNSALLHAAIIIVVGIFATTLAQPQVLGKLPLQNLLKNELHVSRTLNASFFFLAGLPWYFYSDSHFDMNARRGYGPVPLDLSPFASAVEEIHSTAVSG